MSQEKKYTQVACSTSVSRNMGAHTVLELSSVGLNLMIWEHKLTRKYKLI